MQSKEINILSQEFLTCMNSFLGHPIKDILINDLDYLDNRIDLSNQPEYFKGVFNIANGIIFSLADGKFYNFSHGYNNNQYAIRVNKHIEFSELKYSSIKNNENYKKLNGLIGHKIKSIKPEPQLFFKDSPQLRSIKFYSDGPNFMILGEDSFKTSNSEESYIFDGCWIIMNDEILKRF